MVLWSVVSGLWSVVLLALGARAAVPLERTETWTAPGTAGWSNTVAQVQVSNPGGYLNLAYAAQASPVFVADITKHDLERGVLLTNIAFRFKAVDVVPSTLRLYLHGRYSGRTWFVALPAPAAGEERAYTVAVDFAAGWRQGPVNDAGQFAQDARAADWVGVYVRRHGGTALQNYALDAFQLEGLSYPEDLDVDGIPDQWEQRYGLNSDNPADAAQDLDGDGQSNYAEYRAGTDPTDATSYFRVEVSSAQLPPGAGVAVLWRSVSNRTYTVWRGSNLAAPLSPLASSVAATPPTNVYQDAAATNAGPYFYRVQVDEP